MEQKKKFDDLTVTITDGTKKKLSKLSGSKGIVLYFYPKDDTPGCTKEACDFRDQNLVFEKLGYNVVGVSMDSIASHQKFSQKYSLNFPLIVDEDRKISVASGAYGSKNLYGKIVQGMKRTTFVLSSRLEVLKVYENVRAKGHVERVLRDFNSSD